MYLVSHVSKSAFDERIKNQKWGPNFCLRSLFSGEREEEEEEEGGGGSGRETDTSSASEYNFFPGFKDNSEIRFVLFSLVAVMIILFRIFSWLERSRRFLTILQTTNCTNRLPFFMCAEISATLWL